MNKTALALALTFALAGPMAAFAQTATPAVPAKPADKQVQAPKAKVDCAKAENKAKAECKADAKASDKKS
jgi:hypothetical protein